MAGEIRACTDCLRRWLDEGRPQSGEPGDAYLNPVWEICGECQKHRGDLNLGTLRAQVGTLSAHVVKIVEEFSVLSDAATRLAEIAPTLKQIDADLKILMARETHLGGPSALRGPNVRGPSKEGSTSTNPSSTETRFVVET
jgi:hypothetical protein